MPEIIKQEKAPKTPKAEVPKIDKGAVARFKEALFARRGVVRERVEATTGAKLREQTKGNLGSKAEVISSMAKKIENPEDFLALAKKAVDAAAVNKESSVRDRFTAGNEIREAISALESFGKLQIDLVKEYPEMFKLSEDGKVTFDIASWNYKERSPESDSSVDTKQMYKEILNKHNEVRVILREKMSKIVERFLVLSNGGENKLDLLFRSNSERNIGLLYLKSLKDVKTFFRGSSVSVAPENINKYLSVLEALTKTYNSEDHGDFYDTPHFFDAENKAFEIEGFEGEKIPSLFDNGFQDTEYFTSLKNSSEVINLLTKRLIEGAGVGEGSNEERMTKLVDISCQYISKLGTRLNERGVESFLDSVLGFERGRSGKKVSKLPLELKTKIIAAVFEAIGPRMGKETYLHTGDTKQYDEMIDGKFRKILFDENFETYLGAIGKKIDTMMLGKSNQARNHVHSQMTKEVMQYIYREGGHITDAEEIQRNYERNKPRLDALIKFKKGII